MPFSQDHKKPPVCMWSFSSEYPTDISI